jgi:hypothetical protein
MGFGDLLGGVGDVLHGIGEAARGTDPTYRYAKAQEAALDDERRQQAMVDDLTRAYVFAEQGNMGGVQRLLQDRMDNIGKLKGDPFHTAELLRMAQDPARHGELKQELGGFVQAGIMANRIKLPTGQGGVEGAKQTNVFKNGAIFQALDDTNMQLTLPSGQTIRPGDPQWGAAMAQATQSGVSYAGDVAGAQANASGAANNFWQPQTAQQIAEAAAAIKLATQPGIDKASQAATDAQKKSTALLDKVDQVRGGLFAIDDAISAIDDGASSGKIADLWPSIRTSTLALENAGRRLGLQVIQSATFGALSEGEMKLAMETALPKLEPAALREHLANKKAAQSKLADYMESAAIYLAEPGNTPATWAAEQKAKREQPGNTSQGAQQPANGGKVVDWNDL